MKRTTIFADEEVLRELKVIAKKEKSNLSVTIRKALEDYVSRHRRGRPLPSFVGVGRSGRKDVAERAEELLWERDGSRRERR
ncbi:MAG TPA: ribbon-helix-helix protein, CopG family [Vicinamibacteria bacterium]|nr:ribbon-helix-helix protein, CopG family [Vicinamibacteria bacterium]